MQKKNGQDGRATAVKTSTPDNADSRRHGRWMLDAILAAAAAIGLAGCGDLAAEMRNADGVRLYDASRYDEAARTFEEASYDDPRNADAYYNLAATYHRLGCLQHCPADLTLAEMNYQKCLAWDSDHTECYRGLAVLLVGEGRKDQAFQLLDGWCQTHPNSPDARVELARLNEEFGNRQVAEQQLLEAVHIDPDNARALAALGRIREQAGDKAQALADYQRSLAADGRQPQVASRVSALQGSFAPGPAYGVQPDDRLAGRSSAPTPQ
jgi:tetratricopeptide (TPR) repeat protein